MQVEALRVADYIKSEGTDACDKSINASGIKDDSKLAKTDNTLKSLSVDSSFYDKKGNLTDEDLKKDVTQASELGMNTVKEVENVKNAWDDEATEKCEEDGIDPMDSDVTTLVTVVDEIKMNMAKAGADISKMGGLSDAEIEAMSGSVAQAMDMENSLNDTLTDEQMAYLVKNDLEPTIANLYNAQYAAPANNTQSAMTDEELIDLLTALGDKLDQLISEVETEGTNVDNSVDANQVCGKMLSMDVPLTKDNLEYMLELEAYEKPNEDQVLDAIDDIVAEGGQPQDAYLIEGYSLMDQAREAVDTVQSMNFEDLFDVQSKITLTEVQLSMTVEATFTMMKNGVEVNTSDLSDLLDKLKTQETSLLRMLMKDENGDTSEESLSLFQETMQDMADIAAAPVQMFGQFTDISQSTLSQVHEVSISVTAQFSQMEATYEAVGTEVRRDLGDSINKAFQNVDDILEDLGLETSESNEQAVRILAYNQMDITAESVTDMKSQSELVSRVFKNMTPQVVSEMIKRGENPLDLTMSELNDKTQEIKTEVGADSDSESFAKFLWKAEHSGDISEEERESFIGVYRLLNQVEKTDGAAIGALMGSGQEVTLRNLMTAVRSTKHSGREYEVSDEVGAVEELTVKDLSITEQVEKVFLTNRCRDALETMTPNKMQQVGQETYMQMDPDEFATAMEQISDEDADAAYTANMTEQLKAALEADADVYRVMESFNIPTTANMVSAVQAMMADNNKAFKDLYSKAAEQEDMDIEDLINETYERFLEACDSPDDMAEAEEALGVLAENVMRTMINTEDVNTIDLNGMKLVIQECKAMGQMATSSETFNIPIMVADEAGNMNLKIVRGIGESGLIKMALYMESTGTISSTFKYENDQVNANITCETAQMREMFAQDAPRIAAIMQEETGYSYSFSFVRDSSVDVKEIYMNETGNYSEQEASNSEIQTEALYGIAKSFISIVGEMFS